MKEADLITHVYPLTSIKEIDNLIPILCKEFDLSEKTAIDVLNRDNIGLKFYLQNIKEECFFFVETNYVDKVYRDSYYHYYSTKHYPYKKNSLRISFFDQAMDLDDFKNKTKQDFIQEHYLGFIILRPTIPHVLGRSFFSPVAIKNKDFSICIAQYDSTAYNIKLYVKGFPHASQDRETLSCAETTIWSIMEYFSQKYPQYKSELPSDILKSLNSVSDERQVPSNGLNVQKISYALKSFGFGTKIYSLSPQLNKEKFDNIISCYVESGIPILIVLESHPMIFPKVGHAVICVGHENISDTMIEELEVTKNIPAKLEKPLLDKQIEIYDHDDIKKKFVFMDDNLPAYSLASLDNPCSNYDPVANSDLSQCVITHFVVPLYPKIYLEAFQAKVFIKSFLIEGLLPLSEQSRVYLRTFLTTSRTYKDWLITSDFGPPQLKEYVLSLTMPRFVWITEVSTKDLMKGPHPLACGLIILDATEHNTQNNKAVIFAAYNNNTIKFVDNELEFKAFDIPLSNFKIFENLTKYTTV